MTEEPAELATVLPSGPTSPRQARRFVSEALTAWSLQGLEDSVELLTCELVTNAVLHVGAPVQLRVRKLDGRVRVEVVDESREPPRPAYVWDEDPEGATGRGLLLVEALAAEWGVDPSAEGKVVWFEVGA